MYTIGVTGGIGAGKSGILDYLEKRWNASVIRLDDLGRRVLDPETDGYQNAVSLFGEDIVQADGSLDRKKIADVIFQDEEKRKQLERIIHPAVKDETRRIKADEEKKGTSIFVIEAALLIEEHYDEIYDELWYIYADEATRYSRLKASRGYSDERIRQTIDKQLSEEVFRSTADFVVDNNGDFDAAAQIVDRRICEILKGTET